MKNLLLTLTLVLGTILCLQAQTDYKQWETHRFKAKMGQRENFEKGLAAHNKKYHPADPYKTSIFSIRTGPNSGDYELSMGSMTFTQMEGRPAGNDHDSDWAKVLEYADPIGETIYWREDGDVSYTPAGSESFTTFRWRNSTLLPGGGKRFEEQMLKVVEVLKAKNYSASFKMYWRWGASQGPHVSTELGMKNLAYFDEPNKFSKDFDEVHGDGAYDRFIDELDLCVDRNATYDEIVHYRPDLSSGN